MTIKNIHISNVKWSIALAKQKLSALVHAAMGQPQIIYNRDQPVAVVLNYKEYEESKALHAEENIFNSLHEVRKIVEESGDQLEIPTRKNRRESF